MAEPSPSKPNPNQYGSTCTMPEQYSISVPINPPSIDQASASTEPFNMVQALNYDSIQQMNQIHSVSMAIEPTFIPPNQSINIPYQNQTGLNQNQHYISMSTDQPSPAPQVLNKTDQLAPHQNHRLLTSLAEQLLLQIKQASTTPPPPVPVPGHAEHTNPLSTQHSTHPVPVLGSFSFKVEPIVLHHLNSSSNPNPNQTETISPVQPNRKATPPPKEGTSSTQYSLMNSQANPAQAFENMKRLQPRQVLLNNAGNLANLLPTGTVLAFQALIPSLSNNGKCDKLIDKYLVAAMVGVFTIICLVLSFTDSLSSGDKVFYGIAMPKGLLVLNYDDREQEEAKIRDQLNKLRLRFVDLVHALGAAMVFLVFAFSGLGVQSCYFPQSKETDHSIVTFLPLVAGLLSSFLFAIFPTKRRGIGYTDNMARTDPHKVIKN